MEEKIIFSISDYEKAIVRVLRSDDTEKFGVVGTGFLVAPGYVLTCTHVVLQALGQFDPDKETASDPPICEIVELDFPLAQGLPTKAEVLYNSQPYQKNSGDITVLKLLETAPQQSKPMPMIFHTWEEIQAERHAVHGFANDSGDRTDAYRPKSGAPGGRIQLWKAGADPLDEMIEGGFSGAPVWNYDRGGVIGMVATAASPQGQKSKAFAISTETLKPVLEQIKAFCLNDILSQSLEQCSNEDEKANLRIAIATALNLCNPQGADRSWQVQLVDLNCDRPPMLGWETEGRLVHFAMVLARMDDISAHTSEQIEIWVNQCGFSFSDLFVRIDREMKQKKIPTSSACQHLMVVVNPIETSSDKLRISLWVVSDRETYDSSNSIKPMVLNHILTTSELPIFIRTKIREDLPYKSSPIIHLFVPRSLLNCDIAMLPTGSKLFRTLGSEYPVVLRTNLENLPIDNRYRGAWNEKWEKIQTTFSHQTCDTLQLVDCSSSEEDLLEEMMPINAAVLQNCDSVADLFELVAEETALPVALWSRDTDFHGQLMDMLDCIVEKLPDRIRQERYKVRRSGLEQKLGHHLSLVWEDPKIVPPDKMRFDPEAC